MQSSILAAEVLLLDSFAAWYTQIRDRHRYRDRRRDRNRHQFMTAHLFHLLLSGADSDCHSDTEQRSGLCCYPEVDYDRLPFRPLRGSSSALFANEIGEMGAVPEIIKLRRSWLP